MKKILYALLSAGFVITGCQTNGLPDTPPELNNERIFGARIPESERIPDVLNILFNEETSRELEQITGPDGNVQLGRTRSFGSDGILRMHRLEKQ